jgi:hypothetical protein
LVCPSEEYFASFRFDQLIGPHLRFFGDSTYPAFSPSFASPIDEFKISQSSSIEVNPILPFFANRFDKPYNGPWIVLVKTIYANNIIFHRVGPDI